MRFSPTRLAALFSVLSLGASPEPIDAQQLKMLPVAPTANQPAAAGQDEQPASNGAASFRDLLREGQRLRADHQWRSLTDHYKKSLDTYPNSVELKSLFHHAQAREDIERRYADVSFRNSVRTLTDRETIDLYSELLAKVQGHYVDQPDWNSVIARGLVFAREALLSDQVRTLATNVPHEQFDSLRRELWKYMHNRQAKDVTEAREAAWFAGQLANKRVGIPAPALMLEFIAGATSALDTYSSFLTPDQLDEVFSQIEGNFVGLGVELEMLPEALKIVNVIPGGPAFTAGIGIGDHLMSIDTKTVASLGAPAAANLLRGEEGSLVTVGVKRPDGSERQLRIVRRVVEVPSVIHTKIVDEQHKVGYFKLSSFQKSTSRDVDNALWTLHKQGMQSLILDLRGNPGGLLDAAVQVADKFLQQGAIVSTRGRTEKYEFKAHHEGTWGLPLVVLIDGDSASASEILAGALRDHKRAQVVGTRSYGKGSVQGIFPLSIGKAGVRLTTAKFYSPSGRAISNNGVLPTTQVRITAKVPLNDQGTISKDSLLSSAIRVVRNEAAQQRALRTGLSAR